MKLASRIVLLAAAVASLGAAAAAKDERNAHTGPKLRAIVSPVEVKVQNVATTVTTPSGNTTVAFLDLQQPTEFGSGLTEMLTTALVESGRYVVLDRAMLEEFAREQSVGGVDPLSASAAGRLLGAQIVVKAVVTEISFKRSGGGTNLVSEFADGSVAKSVATVAIDLRLVDVESGEILDSARAIGKAGSKLMSLSLRDEDVQIGLASFDNGPLGLAVRSAIGEAVRLIGERTAHVPWEARVAEVVEQDGATSLYLNAGRQSGLRIGDVLDVYRAGKPIVDPETGVRIGKTRGMAVGKCRVESVETKVSVAAAFDGTGFQRDDVVRLNLP